MTSVNLSREVDLSVPSVQPAGRCGDFSFSKGISPVLYQVKFRKSNNKYWERLTHVSHMKKYLTKDKRFLVDEEVRKLFSAPEANEALAPPPNKALLFYETHL